MYFDYTAYFWIFEILNVTRIYLTLYFVQCKSTLQGDQIIQSKLCQEVTKIPI